MGFWSGVCDLVSSACSTVVGAVKAIGSSLAGLATGILKVAGLFLSSIGPIAKASGIALGFFKPKDNLDELGYRAIQSEKSCEEFDSTELYVNHLRNDVKIDQEKFKNQTKEEKMANRAVGIGITTIGIKEKTGVDVSPEVWAEVGRHSFSHEMMLNLINRCKADNNLSNIGDYLKNNSMSMEDKLAAGEKLRSVVAEQNSDLGADGVADRVQDMCAESRK